MNNSSAGGLSKIAVHQDEMAGSREAALVNTSKEDNGEKCNRLSRTIIWC